MSDNILKYLRKFLFFVSILALNGCTVTRLTGSWVNPEYQGRGFNRLLVLGVSENQTYLRIFEKSLSLKLKQYGVMAEPGYTLFAGEKRPSRETMTKRISAQGFDTMIISKVTGRRTEEVYHPGEFYYVRDPFYANPFYGWQRPYPPRFYRHHWYDYYSSSYLLVQEPGYVTRYEVITVESNIYDVRTDEIIWSGVTDTVVQGKIENLINSLVDTLVKELADKKLI